MKARPLYDGTRFGLLLQLAVGPVCLYVLRTAAGQGVWRGLEAVVGVALVDALFVAFAALGVTRWAEGGRVRRVLRLGGAAVMALFAIDIIAAAAGVPIIPSLTLGSRKGGRSAFLAALLLTASNPLTIVFWAGVLGARVAAAQYGRAELWLFSSGCVLSTVAFLTAIVIAGAVVGRTLPVGALMGLNVTVGCALLYFAAKLALHGAPGSEQPRCARP